MLLPNPGEHDKQVLPDRVRQLYAGLGSKQKMQIELACLHRTSNRRRGACWFCR